MKKNFLKFVVLMIAILVFGASMVFAAQLDPTIPVFDSKYLSLNSDGTAKFIAPSYSGKWKRFDIQLLKRVSTIDSSTSTVVYSYKTQGSVKHAEPTDTSFDFIISSVGYYQFQIRGVNLDGNYGQWAMIVDSSAWSTYEGVPVTEDDISAGGGNSGSGSGPGYWYDYYSGPGVNQYGYYPYYPYGYQGYYNPQQSVIPQSPNYNYQQGYISPNNGTSNYPQVTAPNVSAMYGYNNQGNSQTNPNFYSGGSTNYAGSSPNITQGLEIGWHVDSNGRFYYQGNGVVLKGTWYLIDGSYYRFSNSGYILANQWFKDNSTGYWYYLAGDGRMVTGWQNINGTWYYFKPENGNGYGTMYSNTTLQISDSTWGTGVYAFDANGAAVMNAWYGGHYYDKNGKRAN